MRAIKEAIYIRVNNPSLNRNIGKYHLPHIWDEVLFNTPTMPKGCRSFTGMVNFLSMFCPELQRLFRPIYDLTRKGRHFIWGKEHQEAFEEIKRRLIKAPV